MNRSLSLVVRRTIPGTPERLFEAWTDPARLVEWWGPQGVTCDAAEVDLRVGGSYRLSNRLPDGRVLWIAGQYELVDPPRELIFSWRVENASSERPERVKVRFEPKGAFTEVIVVHEHIPDATTRARHEAGWQGCLDGLSKLRPRGIL